MTCEDIDELRSEVKVLRRHLTDLENKVNRCIWGPAKPEGIAAYPYSLSEEELKEHFKRYIGKDLEKCLREHIENEIKEVEEREAAEECRFGSRSPMKAYWAGMKVGYTNIRCWLDQRRG
jgi:predicted metal-dependent hydrolase